MFLPDLNVSKSVAIPSRVGILGLTGITDANSDFTTLRFSFAEQAKGKRILVLTRFNIIREPGALTNIPLGDILPHQMWQATS
jgi:hypothetical protein